MLFPVSSSTTLTIVPKEGARGSQGQTFILDIHKENDLTRAVRNDS